MSFYSQKRPSAMFCKKENPAFRNIHRKTPVLDFLFNKTAGLACNFNKKRLQHRCFPVNYAKCLSTTILKDIYQRLLLYSFWWTCEQKQETAKS